MWREPGWSTLPPMSRRVTILGSGVCGLAIGVKLLELDPSLQINIIEAQDKVGGLARSLTVGDQVADLGPHRIHTELPDVQDFLQDLAGEDMRRVERRSRMWIRNHWIEYPPKPLETLRVFGPIKVAQVLMSFAENILGLGKCYETDNYEAVMTQKFGRELYKLIALDYTRKVWKVDPKSIHGDIARVRVSAGGLDRLIKRVLVGEKEGQETALKKFYYIPGGVEKIATRMAERIRAAGGTIETNRRVTGLEQKRTGHWRVTTQGVEGRERTDTADLVFSTIPVTDLLQFLLAEKADHAVANAREEMRFIANFLVCVVVNRPRVTNCQWLYFPGRDIIFNRGYEPKNFAPEMGAPDTSMILLEITCQHGDRIWNATDKQLVRKTIEGLGKAGSNARSSHSPHVSAVRSGVS